MLVQHAQIRIVLKEHVNQAALRVDGLVLFNDQFGQQKVGNHKQHDQQRKRGQLAFTFSDRVHDRIHFQSPGLAHSPSAAVLKADCAPNCGVNVFCSKLKT